MRSMRCASRYRADTLVSIAAAGKPPERGSANDIVAVWRHATSIRRTYSTKRGFHEPIQDQRRLDLEKVLTDVFDPQHLPGLFDPLAHRVDVNVARRGRARQTQPLRDL